MTLTTRRTRTHGPPHRERTDSHARLVDRVPPRQHGGPGEAGSNHAGRAGVTVPRLPARGETDWFDLAVIGSGPAGEKGANQAAYHGYRVAVAERCSEPGGGAIAVSGVPVKALRDTAVYLTGWSRRDVYGVGDLARARDADESPAGSRGRGGGDDDGDGRREPGAARC